MDDIFSDKEQNDPNKDYAAELIGDGKRYADVKVAAKALLDKDAFIERLKAENADMRKSISSEAKLDALLDQLKNINAPSSGNANSVSHQPHESVPQMNTQPQSEALTVDKVQRLLEEREAKQREDRNLSLAVQKAKEAFGANAKSVIEGKASELGMSYDELIEEAKKRPQAFLKLIEANGPVTMPNAPRTQVNTAPSRDSNGNVKNNAYYSQLRKTLGNEKFFTPAIQNEMERNAKQLGEAFWN